MEWGEGYDTFILSSKQVLQVLKEFQSEQKESDSLDDELESLDDDELEELE